MSYIFLTIEQISSRMYECKNEKFRCIKTRDLANFELADATLLNAAMIQYRSLLVQYFDFRLFIVRLSEVSVHQYISQQLQKTLLNERLTVASC